MGTKRLAEAVEELLRWGVEMDEPRLDWIEVQVDRRALEEVRKALAECRERYPRGWTPDDERRG